MIPEDRRHRGRVNSAPPSARCNTHQAMIPKNLRHLGWWCLLASVPVLVGCLSAAGSTEPPDTGSETHFLVDFQAGNCRTDSELLVQSETALTQIESTGYAGLECASWKATGESGLLLDLLHVSGICGEIYEPVATMDGETLTLGLNNPLGLPPACDPCFYDFSFEFAGTSGTGDLPIDIEIGSFGLLLIPGDQRDSGIRCRHVTWPTMLQQFGSCGTLHTACHVQGTESRVPCEPEPVAPCLDGLECAAVGYNDICVQTCLTVDDCPLQGLLRCDEGRCVLAEPLSSP